MIKKNNGLRGKGKLSSALNSEISGGLAAKKPKWFSILVIAILFVVIWIYSIVSIGFKEGSIITITLVVIAVFSLLSPQRKSVDFKLKKNDDEQ